MAEKKILAAIHELIMTRNGESDWEKVIEKFPELINEKAIKAMQRIVDGFDKGITPQEIYEHWQVRIEFIKKKLQN